jgi:GntR family transcriptional regulator
LIIKLDFASDIPIYQQIRNQIVLGISRGDLKPGQQLPTTRHLASESGINTMTVNKAYQLLKQEGYITSDRRKGTIISEMGNTGLPAKAKEFLLLAASEAKISGMSETEFLEICKSYYLQK